MDELRLLKNSRENLLWSIENSSKLREEFSNQVIAIKNKGIVANSDNVNDLLKQLELKNVNKNEVLIKHVSSGKEIVIF